jgi:hypothetical protein
VAKAPASAIGLWLRGKLPRRVILHGALGAYLMGQQRKILQKRPYMKKSEEPKETLSISDTAGPAGLRLFSLIQHAISP